jgi:hypothetical protein
MSQPNGLLTAHMNTKTRIWISLAAAVALVGCPSEDKPDDASTSLAGDGDGDTGTGETASGDGDGDGDVTETGDGDGDPGDGDGDPVCDELDCDDTGRCWVTMVDWTADAQVISQADLDEAIEVGTLTPEPVLEGVSCWSYAPGAHTCVLDQPPCYLLVGRPEAELVLTGSCDAVAMGSWSSTGVDDMGNCWGIFDEGVAVRLRE